MSTYMENREVLQFTPFSPVLICSYIIYDQQLSMSNIHFLNHLRAERHFFYVTMAYYWTERTVQSLDRSYQHTDCSHSREGVEDALDFFLLLIGKGQNKLKTILLNRKECVKHLLT